MWAKDKTVSRQYWFNSHSSFSTFFYPLSHFFNYFFFPLLEAGKLISCPFFCSLLFVNNLTPRNSGSVSWTVWSQAKPDQALFEIQNKLFFLSSALLLQIKSSLLLVCCVWCEVKIYSTTQQIPLFWSATSFLKQWIPVIKWIENVRQSRNNSDYGNQKLVVNISKFPPDTDMLFNINKNKKHFVLMGDFACSWCIIK